MKSSSDDESYKLYCRVLSWDVVNKCSAVGKILTFEFMNEILKCDDSIESYFDDLCLTMFNDKKTR